MTKRTIPPLPTKISDAWTEMVNKAFYETQKEPCSLEAKTIIAVNSYLRKIEREYHGVSRVARLLYRSTAKGDE